MAQTIIGFVVLAILAYGDAYMWNQLTSHYQQAPYQPPQQYHQPQQFQQQPYRQYAPSPYPPQQQPQEQQYYGSTVNSYRTRPLLTSFASAIPGSQMNNFQKSSPPLKSVFINPPAPTPASNPTNQPSNPTNQPSNLGQNQTNLSMADLIGAPLPTQTTQTTPLPPLDIFGQQPQNTVGQNLDIFGQSKSSLGQLLAQNTNSLNQIQNGFGQSQNDFGQQQNSFSQNQNGFGQSQNGFGHQQNSFSQNQNGFGQQQNSFGRTHHGFNKHQKQFGQKQNRFGQQKTDFRQQNSLGQGPLSLMPPRGAASGPHSGFKMGGAMGGKATPTRRMMPITPRIKLLVDKLALQLGHQAYYAAHGCVDPTTTLLGKQAQIAKFGMMTGCNSFQAKHTCQMVQMAAGQAAGGRMGMMMGMMLPAHTKKLLEQCISPSTLMGGMSSMMMSQRVNPLRPDCRQVSQMMMMGAPAEGGMFSPEGMEAIGVMRNKYLPMQCNEKIIMGMFPLRMCCPGEVRTPSMQEAMMIKGMGGGGAA